MITRVRVETMAKSFVSIMYLRTAVRDAITTMTMSKTIDTNHWRKTENMKLNISLGEEDRKSNNNSNGDTTPCHMKPYEHERNSLMSRIQIGDLRSHTLLCWCCCSFFYIQWAEAGASEMPYTAHWFNFSSYGFSSCHILLTNIREWDCFSWWCAIAFIEFVFSFH